MKPDLSLPTQARQVDVILQAKGTTLKAFLEAQYTAGKTYEEIAQELYATTDRAVSVSYQTIKRWLQRFDLMKEAS